MADERTRVSPLVQAEIGRRFDERDAAHIVQRLEESPLPMLNGAARDRERARVQLAILKLADGDAVRFERHLSAAMRDWRNVLVAAGLAHANWPEILRAAGFAVP